MNVELKIGNYILYVKVSEEDDKQIAIITGYSGGGSSLVIPDYVDIDTKLATNTATIADMNVDTDTAEYFSDSKQIPIVGISKKALMGLTSLREVSFSGSIHALEDWAFAQCRNLNKVIIRTTEAPADYMNQLALGRGVFDECTRIASVCIGSDKENALAVMLGAVLNRMDAEYLLRSKAVGSEDWYHQWDQALTIFLRQSDSDGYTDMVLCGEEDLNINEADYIADMRKRKSALCILRLAHDEQLKADMRIVFIDYLLAHTKGSASEEAWEVLLSEFGDHVDYFKLFTEIGCINQDNVEAVIMDMGEQHAEAKAFVIGYKQEHLVEDDFFSQFNL